MGGKEVKGKGKGKEDVLEVNLLFTKFIQMHVDNGRII
jgi:hypothetical protein